VGPAAAVAAPLQAVDELTARLAGFDGLVARLALELATSVRSLTVRINDLERELTASVKTLAPTLLTPPGLAVLTAAKILGETADVTRFKSKDARHTRTAPLPAWSGNPRRHRLARTGNRQLNCALHRIAVTQGRCHPDARAFLERRIATGNTRSEALRALKRRLSDVVYRDLLHDATPVNIAPIEAAA
jgi:transposase